MEIYDIPCVKGFMRMCNDGWLQGWHERNGGNLTYRMTRRTWQPAVPSLTRPPASGSRWVSRRTTWPASTSSPPVPQVLPQRGARPHPLHRHCRDQCAGDSWRIVWGLADGAKPTSEFPTHFMNHSVRKAVTGGANRVIYHCHATNVIALTYICR